MAYENSDSDFETWQNVTEARVIVARLDAHGQIRHEIVGGGRTLHLTPRERRLNQEKAANEDLDFFLNGTLQPVRLVEGNEDTDRLLANPNHLTDSDARALFKAGTKKFEERVAEIRNVAAIERLLALAGDESVSATVKQLEILKARVAELSPSVENVTVAAGGDVSGGPTTKPVTPR